MVKPRLLLDFASLLTLVDCSQILYVDDRQKTSGSSDICREFDVLVYWVKNKSPTMCLNTKRRL